MKAKLARFYGWTDREIESMEAYKLYPYYLSMQSILAEETLHSINSTAYPHLEKKDRQNLLGKIKKQVTSFIEPKKGLASYSSVVEKLKKASRG